MKNRSHNIKLLFIALILHLGKILSENSSRRLITNSMQKKKQKKTIKTLYYN